MCAKGDLDPNCMFLEINRPSRKSTLFNLIGTLMRGVQVAPLKVKIFIWMFLKAEPLLEEGFLDLILSVCRRILTLYVARLVKILTIALRSIPYGTRRHRCGTWQLLGRTSYWDYLSISSMLTFLVEEFRCGNLHYILCLNLVYLECPESVDLSLGAFQ